MNKLSVADMQLDELQSPVEDELATDSQVAYFSFNSSI